MFEESSEERAARKTLFAGGNPFQLAQRWLSEAEKTEPNDPNAIALATVDPEGLPNVRMVLLKEIETSGEGDSSGGAFVFYTNYTSAKGRELAANPKAALVLHWKSLRRQIRVRGLVEKVDGPQSDDYFASRSYKSRIGAWASQQSQPLENRAALVAQAVKAAAQHPLNPPRPPHWGGFRIRPLEIEFWADGAFRLHDRFRWRRDGVESSDWTVTRLNP